MDMLQELRVHFRQTTAVRLGEMTALLETLQRDPGDAHALYELARHFHALAGLGATYGYRKVSELGDEGEGSMLDIERGRAALSQETLARWRELVEAVAIELRDDGLC
jgi:chemotaxis protein histidine kinase CheA